MKKENQLLNRIGKALGLKADEAQGAVDQDQVVEQVVEATVEQVVDALTVAPVQAALDALTAQFEELQGKFAELSGKYEQAQAALSAIEAEKAEMIAAAAAAKAEARKEQVVAAIGTEKADGFLLATEGLDDTAFAAVLSALVGSGQTEAQSPLFQEVGVTAEVNAEVVEGGESKEMQLLKAKYGKK